MSGNTAGTTTGSTDSNLGSAPLSDPFIAVAVPDHDSVRRVEAPEGFSQLHVRRSIRVATHRSRSTTLTPTSIPPGSEIVDAPPGGKRTKGYVHLVLPSVVEEDGQPSNSVDPNGNGGGLRDIASPQVGLTASRKRAASSAAPGSGRRGTAPRQLASAADFSPTHFNEPVSDGPIPPTDSWDHLSLPPPHQPSFPSSPMAIDPVIPDRDEDPPRNPSPFSSPISHNPLLQRGGSKAAQTPSPLRRRSHSFRTQDGDAAWAVAQGLQPIREGFSMPG